MVLKDEAVFYDVDVMNGKGQTMGVQLMSRDEVEASNKEELMDYLKRKCMEEQEVMV